MRSLEVTSGPGAGHTVQVDTEIVIGREGADLELDDLEISRRHARVGPAPDGRVVVEDLGSTNGTFVDGAKIAGPVTLTASATIRVGATNIAVTIAAPQVTRAQAVADLQPDLTVARPVADAGAVIAEADDRTIQRPRPDFSTAAPPAAGGPSPPIPEPDVTAPRPIAQPDVTAP